MNPESKTGFFGTLLLFAVCAYWFWQVAGLHHSVYDPPWVFLDNANLIFHEAGHVIFSPFGQFLHVLGGSLTQVLIPLLAGVIFWYQGETLGTSFSIFWMGESLVNVSYYIADARTQLLPLLGGDSAGHDWTWLLSHLNALQSDTAIGQVIRIIGVVAMLGGLFWMAALAYRQLTE